MIVDDGLKERCRRNKIFSKQWKMHGAYTGKHSIYEVMTCQNFATGSANVNTRSVKAPRLAS